MPALVTAAAFVEALGVTKIFGTYRAVDDVSIALRPGTFHAIVGENGAGKSTLVKCLLGFQPADAGEFRVDGKPYTITSPSDAHRFKMGMVFQHFTLIPSLTVAENLSLARPDLPAIIHWNEQRARIREFLDRAPFKIDLERRVAHLAAGEKQKVEILKQLYLETRILILDEPTSVLTPAEADEVLGVLRRMVESGELTVVLITHKLREVMQFADEVTVLRRGRCVGHAMVSEMSVPKLAKLMVGDSRPPEHLEKTAAPTGHTPALHLNQLEVRGDNGLLAVRGLSLTVNSGEILGIAGVSGNGQRELIQAIGGQRAIESGEILVHRQAFHPSRDSIRESGLFTLPEEPLQNATVPDMSVAENLALRTFDRAPLARAGWLLDRRAIFIAARDAIKLFSIRPPLPSLPIRSLSGGNVQRTVLARDLGREDARIMAVSNPCFGLDFAATAFVHNHLVELRNRGGSVLLASEDLDELITLADRIVVMSGGAIVHETLRADVDLAVIGRYLGGHVAA